MESRSRTLGLNTRKRERVRCSSLIDWPVYPRLRRIMCGSEWARNSGPHIWLRGQPLTVVGGPFERKRAALFVPQPLQDRPAPPKGRVGRGSGPRRQCRPAPLRGNRPSRRLSLPPPGHFDFPLVREQITG